MNILVLCHEYPPIGGGGGVGAKQYAEAWAEKGHKVTVLTSRRRGLKAKECVGGVEVIRVFTFGSRFRATVSFAAMACYLFFGFLYAVFNLRKIHRFDVVNSHFSLPTGFLGLLISKLFSIPGVVTIIGGDIYDPTKKSSPHRRFIFRVLNSLVLNGSNRIVAISSDTKSRAKQFYRFSNDVSVINYGFIPFSSGQMNPVFLQRENGEYYLISVGRLVKRKGFDYLIRALKLLPPNVKLLLIGDGPLEAELKQLAAEENLDGRVVFTGYKPRQDIIAYLRAADCFVLSSLHEGLGIVVQEAMYAGLPIVSTNNGGQTDLIGEPRNGILVDPQDIDQLAAAIQTFYQGQRLSADVRENNLIDIQKYYIEENSEVYLHLFQELVKVPKLREILDEDRSLAT